MLRTTPNSRILPIALPFWAVIVCLQACQPVYTHQFMLASKSLMLLGKVFCCVLAMLWCLQVAGMDTFCVHVIIISHSSVLLNYRLQLFYDSMKALITIIIYCNHSSWLRSLIPQMHASSLLPGMLHKAFNADCYLHHCVWIWPCPHWYIMHLITMILNNLVLHCCSMFHFSNSHMWKCKTNLAILALQVSTVSSFHTSAGLAVQSTLHQLCPLHSKIRNGFRLAKLYHR